MTKLSIFFILFIALFLFPACGIFTAKVHKQSYDFKHPYKSPEAENILLMLKNENDKLKTFKGIGKIKLWNKGKIQINERAAWIGASPESMRILIRNISGMPLASLSTDGKHLYFASHVDRHFYKKSLTDDGLKPIISIPIKPEEIIALLAGRVPLRKYKYAALTKNRANEGYILLLGKNRWNVIEKIYLNENKNKIYKVEVYDETGSLLYRSVFENVEAQNVKEYKVPSQLMISNDEGIVFKLLIDKYWADVSILPSMFVLKPQD